MLTSLEPHTDRVQSISFQTMQQSSMDYRDMIDDDFLGRRVSREIHFSFFFRGGQYLIRNMMYSEWSRDLIYILTLVGANNFPYHYYGLLSEPPRPRISGSGRLIVNFSRNADHRRDFSQSHL